jgi:uncharacterized protein YdeI (YjbR/CyaY-like superfamily)
MDNFPEIYFPNRDEWRKWLSDNYDKMRGVWVIFFKKETGKASLDYNEFVEEALCFGWIDGIIKNVDNEKYLRKVMPRTNLTKWSAINCQRFEKLVAEGRMTEAGMQKADNYAGTGKLVCQKEEIILPTSFSKVCWDLLQQNSVALSNYNKLSESNKKRYTVWVMSAKQESTQLKRMNEAVRLLEINHKNLLK